MNFLQKLYEPIRKGNEYREQLRLKNPRVVQHPKPVIPRRTQNAEQKDRFRLGFEYWDEWTGSRFERRENPCLFMTDEEFFRSRWGRLYSNGYDRPKIAIGTVCRSNPVTGDWEPHHG